MKTTDYIDRKRAANFICKIICGSDRGLCVSTPENCQQKRMMAFFELPTADVMPVMHGEWESGNPICPICGENKFNGLDADIWADWKPPYCPNCGTKMSSE